MKKLELNQMEVIDGGDADLWGLAGFTCAIAIGSAIALTIGTFGASAILGATFCTAGCALSTSAATWY